MQFESFSTPQIPSAKTLKVSFCYAPEDKEMQVELKKHLIRLEREYPSSAWYDDKTEPGDEWSTEIEKHLSLANVILLLVSQNFFASHSCSDTEMKLALARHEEGEARVIPIILDHCTWKDTPLHKLQVLPKEGKPITSWPNREEALVNVAEGIQRVVKRFMTNTSSVQPQSGNQPPLAPNTRKPIPGIDKPNFSRGISIALISILILLLTSRGLFVLPALLPKPSPDLFPPLCSGNFQSTNTSIVSAPATITSPDGEPIGLSEGATIFDLNRSNQQEVQDKLQAAHDWMDNPQDVVSSLKKALSSDQTDAEAQIYLENWQVLGSNHPHLTLVVGVSFAPTTPGTSRGTLQGAFTAQKECNDRNRQDASKTLIVLMITNLNGNTPDESASSAKFVADQIADQAVKDPTIIGIPGWSTSINSINVNHELKMRGSRLSMISPSSSNDRLEGISNFFRVCPTNSDLTKIATDFMIQKKHKRRVSILYDDTNSNSNNLKDDLTKDIPHNIVGSTPFTGGDAGTVQDALTKVLDQKPDAIFFAGQVNDLVTLLNKISSTSSANLLIFGGNALATTTAYPKPLPDMHNVYFPTFASPNEWNGTSQIPRFFQEYKDNFGTLTAPTGLPSIDEAVMLSYDAMLALLYGTQQVLYTHNTINASDLTEALKQITSQNAIQGITGRIAFDSNGNQRYKRIILEHIEGTRLQVDDSQGCFLLTDNCSS